jgi:hypothetical protein
MGLYRLRRYPDQWGGGYHCLFVGPSRLLYVSEDTWNRSDGLILSKT